MSGEYFCIEEVADPLTYFDDYDTKSNRSSPVDRRNCYNPRDRDDVRSTSSRKSQDFRLYEIEEQLEIAENRCNTLKGQLDSMKKFYSKTGKGDGISRTSSVVPNVAIATRDKSAGQKNLRKRISSGTRTRNGSGSRLDSSTAERQDRAESTDTIPQKSSSSSTAVPPPSTNTVSTSRPKEAFGSHLVRQNSYSIGTDDTGSAVRTINNILTGITDSVNRLSQLHSHDREKKKQKKQKDAGVTFSTPFSPRLEKRINEQQKRIEEMVRGIDSTENNADSSTKEELESQIQSSVNIKSNTKVRGNWSRHTSAKSPVAKTKIQSSSASVNLRKPIKSTAKAVENTTKMQSVRNSMMEDESHSGIITRKRKRSSLKRLKPSSKVSVVSRKFNDHTNSKNYQEYTTDNNLVELYHNIAAKTSDSDDSNNVNAKESNIKTQISIKQKGGGDLPTIASKHQHQQYHQHQSQLQHQTQPQTHYQFQQQQHQQQQQLHQLQHPNQSVLPSFQIHVDDSLTARPVTRKNFPPSRALTPINENGFLEQDQLINQNEYYAKNYELPTIASKMKQVTKCYLQSFNFRSIPFCAARSTSPSHNIGINIQQVMSIIKTRQPISGISPTLAHNISLAAGKLQSRPLTTVVSSLGSKVGYYRPSQCPLYKSQLNYNQLQEMAKEIPEEPAFAGDQNQNAIVENEVIANGPSGDREEVNEPATWTIDPSCGQQRCTCDSEKGVPFKQILSKFQMSTESLYPNKKSTRSNLLQVRRQSLYTPVKKQQTNCKSWYNKNDVNMNMTSNLSVNMHMNAHAKVNTNLVVNTKVEAANKPNEITTLQGKEKNLKTVLKNLHDEFDSLNTKYENLAKTVGKENEEAPPEAMKELEQIEKALNKKEEEINMVMSLYTEVLALKDQVKKLRERTQSQASLLLAKCPSKGAGTDFKEPKAVVHLTQLLRQIQNYQMHCKHKV